MKYELYQMRDNVTGLFLYPIMTFLNENDAKRYFEWQVNNGQLPPMSEKDMELYKVGETNSETGAITPIEKSFICRSADVYKEKKDA